MDHDARIGQQNKAEMYSLLDRSPGQTKTHNVGRNQQDVAGLECTVQVWIGKGKH